MLGDEQIGNWSKARLDQYIRRIAQSSSPNAFDSLKVVDAIDLSDTALRSLQDRLVTKRGTAFPTNPYHGQEFILVDSEASPTYQWRFFYNAQSTYADKWEFIGGFPAYVETDTDETITSAATWMSLSGPTFTVSRAGVYLVEGLARYYTGAGSDSLWLGSALNAAVPAVPHSAFGSVSGSNVHITHADGYGCAVGDVIRLRYFSSARADNHTLSRKMFITPQRLS